MERWSCPMHNPGQTRVHKFAAKQKRASIRFLCPIDFGGPSGPNRAHAPLEMKEVTSPTFLEGWVNRAHRAPKSHTPELLHMCWP